MAFAVYNQAFFIAKMNNKSINKANNQENIPNVTSTKGIFNLIDLLHFINLRIPEARLNATSVSDNNGGRIVL